MSVSSWHPFAVLALVFTTGCLVFGPNHGADPGADGAEGAFAGECHNGEDDDRDGLVDCRDKDCASATNCAPHVIDDDTGDSGADEYSATAAEELGIPGLVPDPIEEYAVPATTAGAVLVMAWRRRRRG